MRAFPVSTALSRVRTTTGITAGAGINAIIACHDAKFTYWSIRPTQADPAMTPAIGLPNFPSYPSDHACISSAQSEILAKTPFPLR